MTPEQKIERIKKALHYAGDYHTWDDVVEGLKSGRYQIFDNASGCIVTEIIQLPRGRYLNCWLLGGELPHVLDLVPDMQRHAVVNDCSKLMAFGRRGWGKVLPAMGWRITGTTFEKDASDA